MKLNSKTRSRDAEWIAAKLRDLGVSLPLGGRFDHMLSVSRGPNEQSSQNTATLLRAEKDLQELKIILETLEMMPPCLDAHKMLQIVIANDPLHPAAKNNSPGRDVQFELFTAAILTRAKMNPRRPEGDGLADFIVELSNGLEYAVEAKRIKGKHFYENFKKACEQIAATGLTGFIFMDLGPFLHEGKDSADVPMTDSDFCSQSIKQLKKFFSVRLPDLRRIRDGRPIRSIHAVSWLIRESTSRGWGLDTFYYGVPLDEHHPKRKFESLYFQEYFNLGLSGAMDRLDTVTREMHKLVKSSADMRSLLPSSKR